MDDGEKKCHCKLSCEPNQIFTWLLSLEWYNMSEQARPVAGYPGACDSSDRLIQEIGWYI